MLKKKKKNRLTPQQTLSILMAAVNGFNSIAPLALPLAAITETAPFQRHINQDALYSHLNKTGQILDKLLFTTAYASYTPIITPGMSVTGETLQDMNALQTIDNGGTATSTTISNSGWQYDNGMAISTTIGFLGHQLVNSGGTASSTIINSGGTQGVSDGGQADLTTVNNGGRQVVSAGGTATSTTINARGYQLVNASGTAVSTFINGSSSQQTVNGTATFTTITNGGNQVISSGHATSTTINGGYMTVANIGTAEGTIINSGSQSVYGGGQVDLTNVNSRGTQNVNYDGKAISTTINSGGTQNISQDGMAISTTVQDSGRQSVGSGAIANSTIINGGLQTLSGGLAISTTINSGGMQEVLDLGSATSTIISNGGTQSIYNDGMAISTTVEDGGWQYVASGGTVNSTTINGGLQTLSGGLATSTTINSGGIQEVRANASATTTIISDGGIQNVSAGGNATSTTIGNGGAQNVDFAGSATSTIINSGGIQTVNDFGNADITTINSGGQQTINSGGNANIIIINSGGIQNVNDQGKAVSATINNGGIQNVNLGAKAVSTTINNGGNQNVANGALALDTKIFSGGTQTVTAGGDATRTSIDNGGTQIIRNGSANSTTVNGGGIQYVSKYSYVASTIINSGGTQCLESDATSSHVTVEAGGTISLFNSGSARFTDIITNGGEFIVATHQSVGNRFILDNPQGSANFVINTDLANHESDQIVINGGSSTNTVRVNYDPSFGQGPSVSGSALFATVADGTATFTGVATDAGAYRYIPIISSSQISNTDNEAEAYSILSETQNLVQWFITGLSGGGDSTGGGGGTGIAASETMYTAHDAVANTLTLWRDENNHLVRRMGDLRTGTGHTGDWARVYSGEQELNSIGGRRTTQKYTALQGGHDTKHVSDSGSRFTGYTLSYLNADATMERGTGDASSLSVGAYSSWIGKKGHFLDLILKQGRLRNSFTSYLQNSENTRVDASYNNWGTSLSAEYGYRKSFNNQWYFEPQAEITFNRITGASYTATDGTSVRNDGLNSAIGRLGLTIGKIVKQNSFYLQASLLREFSAHSDVTMSSGGMKPVTMREDLKETYMEFALGVTTAFNDRTSGYLEASKTTGDKVRTPWLLNAGIRRSF